LTVARQDEHGATGVRTAWPVVRCGQKDQSSCEHRLGLLVVGYANDAQHFDKHLAEYEAFLSKVSVAKVTSHLQGTQMGTGAPASLPPASPLPASPAASAVPASR
jgi:hypothetical protein